MRNSRDIGRRIKATLNCYTIEPFHIRSDQPTISDDKAAVAKTPHDGNVSDAPLMHEIELSPVTGAMPKDAADMGAGSGAGSNEVKQFPFRRQLAFARLGGQWRAVLKGLAELAAKGGAGAGGDFDHGVYAWGVTKTTERSNGPGPSTLWRLMYLKALLLLVIFQAGVLFALGFDSLFPRCIGHGQCKDGEWCTYSTHQDQLVPG